MASQTDDDLKTYWRELHDDFYPLQTTSNDPNTEFKNESLLNDLRQLRTDATFAPLIARDIASHKHFAPASQSNTWEIVFNEEWQCNDRSNRFNKWCKRTHRPPKYDDIMCKFDHFLNAWQCKLCLPDQEKLTSWFRPPTFPSTLKMSLEIELPSEWSSFYKQQRRRYRIDFSVNKLYFSYHCNLIDAIYFAKCVNWDAAYDPKHSAKTNIPIYWILAELTFHFPSDAHQRTTFAVPVSCYGLTDIAVNLIKDWYKLSPFCPECSDLRGKLQINDQVEVLLNTQRSLSWERGQIIDIVILNSNEAHNADQHEPIVEYLQVQTVNDALIRYNRYDERLRPFISSQSVQSDNNHIRYKSQLLNDAMQSDEALLTPPHHIQQDVAPQYQIDNKAASDKVEEAAVAVAAAERIEEDEYKIGADGATPEFTAPSQRKHINRELLDSFDYRNTDIMEEYQNEIEETMQTMKELALHGHDGYNDIFRPVHLMCPKLQYRVGADDEENEVYLSVVARNKEFEHIRLKMIDPFDVAESQFDIYLTEEQLFKHCTTYFHFADMDMAPQRLHKMQSGPQQNGDEEQMYSVAAEVAVYGLDESKQNAAAFDPIHQYMRSKDSSISPKRKQSLLDSVNMDFAESEDAEEKNPRSHLQDNELQSFLHETESVDPEADSNWINANFVGALEQSQSASVQLDGDGDDGSAQQAFIANAWNAKPNRLGLGATALSTSNSQRAHASFQQCGDDLSVHSSANSVRSFSTNSMDSSVAEPVIDAVTNAEFERLPQRVYGNEPRTPKMVDSSPSNQANDCEEEEEVMVDTVDTPEIDLNETNDLNVGISDNNRCRLSVDRTLLSPQSNVRHDGDEEEEDDGDMQFKFDDNFEFEDDFNGIGMNEYDADELDIDEDINAMNDDYEMEEVAIQRLYTAAPICCNIYVFIGIVLSVLGLVFGAGAVLEHPYLVPVEEWMSDQYNFLIQKIIVLLLEHGLIRI